uniref:Uncharacterized protein n=1 Tax=Molossus molossus TaxID=27622 RepID=A0A7J8J7B1_MOLMO|nr:hypothetical protein HJG59_009624 [Molossus molossus]
MNLNSLPKGFIGHQKSAHTPYSDVIFKDHSIAGHCHSRPAIECSPRCWPSILPACLQMMTRRNLCRTAWKQLTRQMAAQTSGMTHCHHQMRSCRPCSLPRRPSINTSAMPCLCPPRTLCTLSSQGLDVNKEIHHPGTNSSLEETILSSCLHQQLSRSKAFQSGCTIHG